MSAPEATIAPTDTPTVASVIPTPNPKKAPRKPGKPRAKHPAAKVATTATAGPSPLASLTEAAETTVTAPVPTPKQPRAKRTPKAAVPLTIAVPLVLRDRETTDAAVAIQAEEPLPAAVIAAAAAVTTTPIAEPVTPPVSAVPTAADAALRLVGTVASVAGKAAWFAALALLRTTAALLDPNDGPTAQAARTNGAVRFGRWVRPVALAGLAFVRETHRVFSAEANATTARSMRRIGSLDLRKVDLVRFDAARLSAA